MKILIVAVRMPFITGGAERHAAGLRTALERAGHQVDLVEFPFLTQPPQRIIEGIECCKRFDFGGTHATAADVVIATKFPAYFVRHPQKIIWLLHQHREAYDLWQTPFCGLHKWADGPATREIIHQEDRQLFHDAPRVFTISRNVSRRLERVCGVANEPIYHPPPNAEEMHGDVAEDYFFYPSRIDPLKRQYLVIAALAQTREPVRVRFAGAPVVPEHLRSLQDFAVELGVHDRIEWLGPVTDAEKCEHYARSLAVIFTPLDEDYGYITLEAMLSSKAVLTCADSGGPLEFVRNGETGIVVSAKPTEIAAGLDTLWQNRSLARSCGAAGRDLYQSLDLSWPAAIEKLLAA
jgi:glycosyltransferase involved in cell wall biosynthesis